MCVRESWGEERDAETSEGRKGGREDGYDGWMDRVVCMGELR